MTALSPDTSLDAIRREIDLIDDQLLDLLLRRFAATSRVKATKASDGSIASSPFRPAREAAMLRRLIEKAGPPVSPEILVRLWRVILSASTQAQAPVVLHMDEFLGHDLLTRLTIAQHFCGMEVALHKAPPQAVQALGLRPGDLAIVRTDSDWGGAVVQLAEEGVKVIGSLPVILGANQPQLLVIGHAEPRESGDDETLLYHPAPAPEFQFALWQAPSGNGVLTSLPGFLDSEAPLLRELFSRLPGARIVGRYPRPIKVSA